MNLCTRNYRRGSTQTATIQYDERTGTVTLREPVMVSTAEGTLGYAPPKVYARGASPDTCTRELMRVDSDLRSRGWDFTNETNIPAPRQKAGAK